MAYFLNTIFGTLTPICITVLVTLAITIIFKTSYTTNFAQGVISAFGAFVVAELLNRAGVNIWLAAIVGMCVSMALAVIMDVVIFRNGRYVNALGKQIITMGMISLIMGVIPLIFGTPEGIPFKSFAEGLINFNVGGQEVTITVNSLVCMAITVVIVTVIFVLLKYSKWGLSVRATASNEYVAGMMGINTHVVTAVSWGLAGALGALAACMNASINPLTSYFMTTHQINAFLAGILGGFAVFHGPVIAAIFLPLITALITWFGNVVGVPELSGWAQVILYAIILIIIFFKPQGIFGKKLVKKV